MARRAAHTFKQSVELDSHFNNLINMLINMLRSKMV